MGDVHGDVEGGCDGGASGGFQAVCHNKNGANENAQWETHSHSPRQTSKRAAKPGGSRPTDVNRRVCGGCSGGKGGGDCEVPHCAANGNAASQTDENNVKSNRTWPLCIKFSFLLEPLQ